MKVIFLDVDGVLSKFGKNGNSGNNLSKPLMRNLSFLVKSSGARVVLSSTWRMFPESRRKLERALRFKGLKIHFSTPVLNGGDIKSRHDEITQWLGEHKEVTDYVILDDIPDYFMQPLAAHVIACDPEEGLTEEKTLEALIVLNVEGIDG